MGAIFEKYFDLVGEDQAEKVAYGMKDIVEKHKEKLLKIDVKKSKEQNKVVYEDREELLIIPDFYDLSSFHFVLLLVLV